MLEGKKIAVVVPAFNEEKQILKVIGSIPDFVDHVVVVDDKSIDRTVQLVQKVIDSEKTTGSSRITLIEHEQNLGVGGAISSGYLWCKDTGIDCSAVMAGDGQMDPKELQSICEPIVKEEVDFVKGNRLNHKDAWASIPKVRYMGNSALSLATRVASGYWRIFDSQTGYTAISLKTLEAIEISKLYPNYGVPNDLLVKLNIAHCSIREISIKPIYNIGEQSKMRFLKVIPRIAFLLVKSFFKRLWVKYLVKGFHPIFLFYHLSFLIGLVVATLMLKTIVLDSFSAENDLQLKTILLSIFSFLSFTMAAWLDIQKNKELYK